MNRNAIAIVAFALCALASGAAMAADDRMKTADKTGRSRPRRILRRFALRQERLRCRSRRRDAGPRSGCRTALS
jgi:hypothetical protein